MMERVRGLDTAFLSLETQSSHLHVAQACVFDPSTSTQGYSFEAVRQLIEDRLDLLPPFRRRLVDVPLRVHHPVSIEDPDFDLDRHLHRVVLPGPGSLSDLAEVVGAFASVPLARQRPLWDMYLVEGLEGGLVAGVTKVHHSAIDGVSGAELTAALLDVEPAPATPPKATGNWVPDRRPDAFQLAVSAAGELARLPVAALGAAAQLTRAAWKIGRRNRVAGAAAPPAPFSAPPTPFDSTLGSGRKVAFSEIPLESLMAVKSAYGVKVNDVLLSACAGALRGVLAARGGLPDRPLVAAVPVSVRTDDERGALGNRLSAMLVGLATTAADPVERLQAVAAGSVAAKAQDQLLGPTLFSDLADLVPPVLGSVLAGAASRLGVLHRPRPLCNVVISSFPGPTFPLYCAGARLLAPYPLGPIIDGAPLNITAQTYLDTVYLGVVTDRQSGPDPWAIASGIDDSLNELVKLAA